VSGYLAATKRVGQSSFCGDRARTYREPVSRSKRHGVKMVTEVAVGINYVLEKKGLIDKALEESIDARSPYTRKIWDGIAYSLLGDGKRIRPALCLAACELFGGSAEDAIPTACALEMIHTMSLIHDDLPCMDNDDLRRGKPTNHKVFGEDMALLAGDALLAYAFEMISKTPKSISADRVVEVLRIVSHCSGAEGLVGGQVMDLEQEGNPNCTVETLRWIHVHKTAVLLKASVTSGAVIGGANKDDVARLGDFAEKIGLAFQIRDDVLDETQTSEVLGKTAGKDAAVYKATYPRLLGLAESRNQATQLVTEAKQILEKYGERSATLNSLADLIISREK